MEAAAPLVYDSVDSSPRSRHTDSWDSPPSSSLPPSSSSAGPAKIRLMCSYGGHIVPRPHDKSLCYLGGTTRMVVVDRQTSLASLSSKLSSLLLDNRPFSLKYQLPNEDLDSLISVSTDEDLENMIEEYDRILASSTHSNSSSASAGSSSAASSAKCSRLRLFLFPLSKADSASSLGSMLEESKSDVWFVDALNGAGALPRGMSTDSSADVNCLLGLDEGVGGAGTADSKPTHLPESPSGKPGKLGQEIHSVPDSPIMETTSSFGSTSSASCLSNLPPIRVHVDEGGVGAHEPRLRLEEHFGQLNVGGVPAVPTTISPSTENPTRVFSDDERFEQGMAGMARKPPQLPSQPQHKLTALDLPMDAVSSDPAAISRQKTGFYQEPVVSVPARDRDRASPTAAVSVGPVSDPKRDVSDPNYRIPMQVQDPGFVLPMQQQEQPQFVQASPHYIHHHATGPVPISSYYPIHPQQQLQQQQQQQQQQHRIDHQYPMFFVPVGQNQTYGPPIQSNLPDPPSIPPSKLPPIPNPAIISSAAYKEPAPAAGLAPVYPAMSAPPSKAEIAANLYRTTAAPPPVAAQPFQAAAPLIHLSDQQQQYMGYHQLHHPSQSAAAVAAAANFTYEFRDPLHAQLYYAQQNSTTLAPQYQTVSSGVVTPEIPLPPPHSAANAKQNRTSQPL